MKDYLRRRVLELTRPIPENSLDRSRRLKSLQVTKRKLINRRAELHAILKEVKTEIKETDAHIGVIKKATVALTPDNDRPTVTEHAMLRYIERFTEIDLKEIHDQVMNLPECDKIMAQNTVITVYPTPDDHFNLAENEKKA